MSNETRSDDAVEGSEKWERPEPTKPFPVKSEPEQAENRPEADDKSDQPAE